VVDIARLDGRLLVERGRRRGRAGRRAKKLTRRREQREVRGRPDSRTEKRNERVSQFRHKTTTSTIESSSVQLWHLARRLLALAAVEPSVLRIDENDPACPLEPAPRLGECSRPLLGRDTKV